MQGAYGGVQKVLKYVLYVHSAIHNLNLVMNDAVREVIDMHRLLKQLNIFYNFFGHIVERKYYQVLYLRKKGSTHLRNIKIIEPY